MFSGFYYHRLLNLWFITGDISIVERFLVALIALFIAFHVGI